MMKLEKKPEQLKYVLTHEQAQMIFDYLGAQPYVKVEHLVASLRSIPMLDDYLKSEKKDQELKLEKKS